MTIGACCNPGGAKNTKLAARCLSNKRVGRNNQQNRYIRNKPIIVHRRTPGMLVAVRCSMLLLLKNAVLDENNE